MRPFLLVPLAGLLAASGAAGAQSSITVAGIVDAGVRHVANDGASTFAVPGGNSGMTAGGASKGYELGVRHNF